MGLVYIHLALLPHVKEALLRVHVGSGEDGGVGAGMVSGNEDEG